MYTPVWKRNKWKCSIQVSNLEIILNLIFCFFIVLIAYLYMLSFQHLTLSLLFSQQTKWGGWVQSQSVSMTELWALTSTEEFFFYPLLLTDIPQSVTLECTTLEKEMLKQWWYDTLVNSSCHLSVKLFIASVNSENQSCLKSRWFRTQQFTVVNH